MKRPNALNPRHLTPLERRAELCALLALGLVRLCQLSQLSAGIGESSLHNPSDPNGHETMQTRRSA